MFIEHQFELTDFTLEVKSDFWVDIEKETRDTPESVTVNYSETTVCKVTESGDRTFVSVNTLTSEQWEELEDLCINKWNNE